MGKFKDLTGQKFGKLTVIERVEDHVTRIGKKLTMWKCLCECQNNVPDNAKQYYITYGNVLNNGKRTSCGCDVKERKSKKMKQFHCKNRSLYDLSGEYGVGTTFRGDVFYFDLDDYDKIKDYNWFVNDQSYLLAYINGAQTIRMHRVVLGVTDNNIEVDHIHGSSSRNDNRKSNLRLATHSQNNINKGLMSNNTSGTTGVDYVKRLNKWRARIHIDNKEILLGLYNTKEDAISIRKEAEKKYFGEWAYDYSIGGDKNEN